MSNEAARRASGAANAASRRAIGAGNEAARRATGSAMIERRTGQSQVDDINAVVAPPRQRKALPVVAPRGAVPVQRGSGKYTPPVTSSGGGIASPVTEDSYALREYWPGGLPSSDGLLFLPAWKKIVMSDADAAEVIFNYAEPT